MKYLCLLTPINYNHKAGDGTKTREKRVKYTFIIVYEYNYISFNNKATVRNKINRAW